MRRRREVVAALVAAACRVAAHGFRAAAAPNPPAPLADDLADGIAGHPTTTGESDPEWRALLQNIKGARRDMAIVDRSVPTPRV